MAAVQEASLRAPSVLFLPHADRFWTDAHTQAATSALATALGALGPEERVLVLTTVDGQLPPDALGTGGPFNT